MASGFEEKEWMVISTAAAIAATLLTRAVLRKSWETTRHQEPPENPASSEASWREALLWGAITGMAVGLARTVARRGATTAWHYATKRRAPVEK